MAELLLKLGNYSLHLIVTSIFIGVRGSLSSCYLPLKLLNLLLCSLHSIYLLKLLLLCFIKLELELLYSLCELLCILLCLNTTILLRQNLCTELLYYSLMVFLLGLDQLFYIFIHHSRANLSIDLLVLHSGELLFQSLQLLFLVN